MPWRCQVIHIIVRSYRTWSFRTNPNAFCLSNWYFVVSVLFKCWKWTQLDRVRSNADHIMLMIPRICDWTWLSLTQYSIFLQQTYKLQIAYAIVLLWCAATLTHKRTNTLAFDLMTTTTSISPRRFWMYQIEKFACNKNLNHKHSYYFVLIVSICHAVSFKIAISLLLASIRQLNYCLRK